jgi:hypothetical protein
LARELEEEPASSRAPRVATQEFVYPHAPYELNFFRVFG